MKRLLPVLMLALVAGLLLPLALALPAAAGSATAAAAASSAVANCPDNHADHVVLGDTYSLAADQTLNGNLIVLGGQATVATGATVNCTVIVLGGSLDLAGKVLQDVVVMGGEANLRATAEVDGRLQSLGGSVSQADGAQIKGGVSQGFSSSTVPSGPSFGGDFPVFQLVFGFYRTVARTVLGALGFGLLALLVVLVWPAQTARVSATLTNAPAQSGALGLLTSIAVPVLMLIATLTVCLIPVAFMAAVVLSAAVAMGWIALGALVGDRLVASLRLINISPPVAAALGTALLSLVMSIVGWVPCVGWVVPVILASAGLGAVTLTRFGTQPYFPASLSAPPAPPVVPNEPALNA